MASSKFCGMRCGEWALVVLLALPGAWPAASDAGEAKPIAIQITFADAVAKEPFTGRVFVVASRTEIRGLRGGISWFNPEPFFAKDVKNWKPGEPLDFAGGLLGHPHSLAELPKGEWWLQAVMDFDRGSPGSPSCLAGDGNGYSKPVKISHDPAAPGSVQLHIDQVYRPRDFPETERVKLVELESRLLSDFHKKPTRLRAAVILPDSFAAEKERKYPVVYSIPGFGGSHFSALRLPPQTVTNLDGIEALYVVLDPGCRWGHHVFADSANNGPCGKALVEELIPHIEKEYRGIGRPEGRFVTGHSSGGWSCLWLQVAYPDFFGGCWSTAPDPVDFRDFQRINIYADKNLFKDAEGQPRPLARRGGKPVLYFQPFSDMEEVMGRGGQLQSFEAVFSPRGDNGRPRPLWDRKTGAIDPETAKAWQEYDISLQLQRRWKTLGPKLAGKLHVFCGGEDTFYLEGAVAKLADVLKELKSDAVVEIIPNKDHGNLVDAALRRRIAKEMAAAYRAHHPER